nr:tyrosine-type recombinase/integrase [Bacillus massiliigorillae]
MNLRHTHATILMRMGENPKVVRKRLGHARVGITLDIYSHYCSWQFIFNFNPFFFIFFNYFM